MRVMMTRWVALVVLTQEVAVVTVMGGMLGRCVCRRLGADSAESLLLSCSADERYNDTKTCRWFHDAGHYWEIGVRVMTGQIKLVVLRR